MEVDNFDLLRGFMTFATPDDFYFIQVLTRPKDSAGGSRGNSKNRVIKTYDVSSVEYFDAIAPEIRTLCGIYNARAYMHASPRSRKKVALEMIRQAAEHVSREDYTGFKGMFSCACGLHTYRDGTKTYLVDVDTKDPAEAGRIREIVERAMPEGPKVLLTVPTVSGLHYICRPFDVRVLEGTGTDVHKNNPTLLYYTSDRTPLAGIGVGNESGQQ